MAYAVVINLDYENHSPEVCKELWGTIRERMCAAGFHCDGRTFTINLPEEQAAARARETMERLEEHLDYHRKHIYRYLKDFYGYDMSCVTNLLVPPVEGIEVEGD